MTRPRHPAGDTIESRVETTAVAANGHAVAVEPRAPARSRFGRQVLSFT